MTTPHRTPLKEHHTGHRSPAAAHTNKSAAAAARAQAGARPQAPRSRQRNIEAAWLQLYRATALQPLATADRTEAGQRSSMPLDRWISTLPAIKMGNGPPKCTYLPCTASHMSTH
jgi:hypothetical protein